MNCPKCESKTEVLETRKTVYYDAVKRRRECPSCGHRFTTKECSQEKFKELLFVKEELKEARAKIRGLENFKQKILGASVALS